MYPSSLTEVSLYKLQQEPLSSDHKGNKILPNKFLNVLSCNPLKTISILLSVLVHVSAFEFFCPVFRESEKVLK